MKTVLWTDMSQHLQQLDCPLTTLCEPAELLDAAKIRPSLPDDRCCVGDGHVATLSAAPELQVRPCAHVLGCLRALMRLQSLKRLRVRVHRVCREGVFRLDCTLALVLAYVFTVYFVRVPSVATVLWLWCLCMTDQCSLCCILL